MEKISVFFLTLPLSFSGAVEFSKLDRRVDQKKIVLKALVRWLRAFWEVLDFRVLAPGQDVKHSSGCKGAVGQHSLSGENDDELEQWNPLLLSAGL